jgi:very-short-patch-repair endonuclease
MNGYIPETRIAALAGRQHGNVSHEQLLALGLGTEAIRYRVRILRYHRPFHRVYSLGRPPKTALEWASAAVLACGEGAVLSHMSALALWGLATRWPRQPEVTVPGDRRPKGITVRRSQTLTRRDVRKHQGIPVTSPARSILDCAPRLTDAQLARLVNDALLSGHLRRAHLAELLQRRHCPRLLPFIETSDGPTRSQFEDAFKRFCKRFRLPEPKINTRVFGHEVDAYFEQEKLIVELDGYAYHSSRKSFESDRLKDAEMLEHGIITVRLTWDRLKRDPQSEADRLLRILQERRS